MLSYRHGDASNQTGMLGGAPYSDWTGYQPVNLPMVMSQPIDPATVVDRNRWQPLTYVDRQGQLVTPGYLGAHWDYVTPFALLSGSQFRPLLPPPAYGSAAFVSEHNELVSISASLNDRRNTLDQDVKMFFLASNAVFDAGIAAWDAKRAFDRVRPITAIR